VPVLSEQRSFCAPKERAGWGYPSAPRRFLAPNEANNAAPNEANFAE
jgi:hypothetical protein